MRLRFTESARIIDHTAAEFLQHVEEESAARGRLFAVEGVAHFQAFSAHPLAARMQEPHIAHEIVERDERAQQMAAQAQRLGLAFAPQVVATINRHDFVYLRRGDQREERNLVHGPWAGGEIRLFDYSHTSAPDYHVPHRHTLMMYELPASTVLPDFVLTPGHYLERYLVNLTERADVPSAPGYRLYVPPGQALPELPAGVRQALGRAGPLYIEIRHRVVLAFFPQRALEGPDNILVLTALATALAEQGEAPGSGP